VIIKNEDLYDLLNVKVGDRIKVIGGEGIKYGVRLEIIENGKFSFGNHNIGHALSKLIDVEFEKVPTKFFEPIQYETAIRRMADEEGTYLKYNGEYLECKIKEDAKRICMYNNKYYITQISFVKALDYKFYALM
jgi:hypothetical protein